MRVENPEIFNIKAVKMFSSMKGGNKVLEELKLNANSVSSLLRLGKTEDVPKKQFLKKMAKQQESSLCETETTI